VDSEPPLRAELFSADQMAQHGRALAGAHKIMAWRGPDRLLARLAANEEALVGVCQILTDAVSEKNRITPAGEWLLDNFYLIEEQIRTAKRHLPKGYSRKLPRLRASRSQTGEAEVGPPRVYDIALEIVAHGDGHIDTAVLSRFIAAYQSVAPLTLGELWATPIMLRLAVIENLRRVAVRIASDRSDQALASHWADRLRETAERDAKNLVLVIADMARSNPPMESAFVAELARRLHGQGPALALPLTWLEQQLADAGQTVERLIQHENQRQASDQVSVSNSIGSLRLLGAVNWREFVEALSVVEQTLREDPAEAYSRMDFATRDLYRHAIERIAIKSRQPEVEVARHAIALARAAVNAGGTIGARRPRHVGYYLIGDGVEELERGVRCRPSFSDAARRSAAKIPLFLYLAPIFTLSMGVAVLMATRPEFPAIPAADLARAAQVLLGLLWLIAASQTAVALVNWLATLVVRARMLPRMDYSEGIPPECRTLVVVPTMLVSPTQVAHLIEALEVRFLANREPRLHFALLTDFCDAGSETLAGDDELLAAARGGIEALNRKYGGGVDEVWDDIFFLFHRPRRHNVQEDVWMGYERKRGKLAALNALLRGERHNGVDDGFSLVVGDTTVLSYIRYVITLDTDTQLPRDAARQFIGAIAHPLNRPEFDAQRKRVVDGYGILQPRVDVSLPAINRSRYARLYGGEPGIDPYTRAVSEIYQDVFGEGSFIGKGIYDLDAFEAALGGRFPENLILSHDLIEGCYARSGLLSDVALFEAYPANYLADVARRRRWIRGDWQIAGWLLRDVPGGPQAADDASAGSGTRRSRKLNSPLQKNTLSWLAQWKILDNLRRSLVAAAICVLLVINWTLVVDAADAAFATLMIVALLFVPALFAILADFLRWPAEAVFRPQLRTFARAAARRLLQIAFELACQPYEAAYSVGAIAKTGWRMLVTRRRLLEWNPAREAERAAATGANELSTFVRAMGFAPVLALGLALVLAAARPALLFVALPILALWFVSPFFAWALSRPLVPRAASLSGAQTRFLRTIARRTWAYFDTFIDAEENWLPPDNYQKYRIAAVAHRTSPTNIGLSLLANLAAYDFGYLCAGKLVSRSANTFATMDKLARERGHFYNWYDTKSLQPLLPLYVSTVDSGNLAGHLLVLRQALLALPDEPVFRPVFFAGLSDTIAILEEVSRGVAGRDERAKIVDFKQRLAGDVPRRQTSLAQTHALLAALAAAADALAASLAAQADEPGANDLTPLETDGGEGKGSENTAADTAKWARALADQCAATLAEVVAGAPWLAMSAAPRGALPEGEADFAAMPTWRELARREDELANAVEARLLSGTLDVAQRTWLTDLKERLGQAGGRAAALIQESEALAVRAGEFAEVDYDFLFDGSRQLFSIGYNVSDHRRDASYYDLLASEARLASFVAIAQGHLPQDNWFSLGRMLTSAGGEPVLLSWSGSMFEYLMPLLVMPTFDDTLLDQTYKAAVACQIAHGSERGLPWGMSESGYNTVDAHFNYQYRAFGVPGLGLMRGLADDAVIAPYATLLALTVAPEAACRNLQRLAAEGYSGRFGFFEAIDYTPARQRRGESRAIVLSYMAHHQAMSLLSLAYLLLGRPMQRRFEADRQFQAVMPLLQERIPKASAVFTRKLQLSDLRSTAAAGETPIRVFTSPDTLAPEVQLLSNGRYHVMVTNAGGGYSRWKDLAVTRWREDATRDHWGSFCYLREASTTDAAPFWSAAYQPTLKRPEAYEAIFSEGRAEFRRRDAVAGGAGAGHFETHTEIVVSPEDDIELRRLRITNRSRQRREIEATSYAEVVIAPAAADALHPVFSNLFVQTEIVAERNAILCTRRPRSHDEKPPWMLHLLVVHGAESVETSYETDRARFIGRGRSAVAPQAMDTGGRLSGSAGSVLDPIVAIRHRIGLDAEAFVIVDMISGVAETREAALALVMKFQDRHLADRVFDLAWTHSQVVLRQLNASEASAQLHARLASAVLYPNASLRADPTLLAKNRRSQSALWAYAISGDLPIVLLRIGDAANIGLVRQLVEAHAYWRQKGLAVDLVIWNEDPASYRQRLQDEIVGLIASGSEAAVIDRPGGIFVRLAELISGDDRILFQSVARAVISDGRGPLAEQLAARRLSDAHPPRLRTPFVSPGESPSRQESAPDKPGERGNGLGEFSGDGREYLITLAAGAATPAPWVNVIANAQFGTIVSESGGAYTFSENAHEFRLTPWHNDPVSDPSGEALYLRDEESGAFWSPTPLPARARAGYTVRHGFGYSVFESRVDGVFAELTIYVALDSAVKFSLLRLRNESGHARRLSATAYVEWVLGDLRPKSAMHVVSEIDAQSGALFARNAYSTEFPGRVAFLDIEDAQSAQRSLTADRTEFIGRNGTLASPAAMKRVRLSGKVGAGLDPCAAMQVRIDLADGQEREIVFRLGVAPNADEAARLAQRWRGAFAARAVLHGIHEHWQRLLGAVQVRTPEAGVNALANGWLVYQTLACRLWARSGYYQSGGAFGFRDQLQDAMALVHAAPQLLRAQLLLCASRQFVEGDVQHWWHPPAGRGVRTRCSDDYLWLPLAISRYVFATADTGVLDETAPFLEGRPVNAGDDSYYDLPGVSVESASLYEHGVRAIRHGLTFGAHGLPLIGSGDWNDGMNRVGIEGKGESVWLAFFLCEVLRQFVQIAAIRGDAAFVELYRSEEARLRGNIEKSAWDGAWYRRAYFDDGQALGSKDNAECRIDSIAQSWSVLSAAGAPGAIGTPAVSPMPAPDLTRARTAMRSLDEHLVRRDAKLVLLLDPPFDKADFDPGYIRGYVPGVRENGGQYTHAAVWAAMAFAALGESDRAWEVLDLINPVRHAQTPDEIAIYKVEPYVITADVYGLAPHTGRGGWSWYTGSAGWTYRLIVESLLGVRREGTRLRIDPRLPKHWDEVAIDYRYRETRYRITITQAAGEKSGEISVSVDGAQQEDSSLALVDDNTEHEVRVRLA
jgi:cellobiose phosphorylase